MLRCEAMNALSADKIAQGGLVDVEARKCFAADWMARRELGQYGSGQ